MERFIHTYLDSNFYHFYDSECGVDRFSINKITPFIEEGEQKYKVEITTYEYSITTYPYDECEKNEIIHIISIS